MRIIIRLSLIMSTIIFSGCWGINTNDPEEAFGYWADIPSKGRVTPIKGKYWKSGHFTYEFIAYLKLTATKDWTDELIKLNNLEMDTITIDSFERSENLETPSWFNPPKNYIKYTRQEADWAPNFALYTDSKSDTIYIFNYQF